jgi:hypothetical protein
MSLYDLLSWNSDNNNIAWPFDDEEEEDHLLMSSIIHRHHSESHPFSVASILLYPRTSDDGVRRPCHCCGSSSSLSCRRNEIRQILDEALAIASEPEDDQETQDATN